MKLCCEGRMPFFFYLHETFLSMKLFQHSLVVQSALLALTTAVTGGILIVLFTASYSSGLWFALGVVAGGIAVSWLVRAPSITGETAATITLYVGNLPYRANEAAVRSLFEQYGHVVSVRLMKDRNTGKRRGFGFVEMPEHAALEAKEALNDTEFQQRTLKVREANEKKEAESDISL